MAVLKYYNTATSAWEYIAASTTANFTTWKKTAAGGETSVSGTDDNSVTLSYTVGLEQVFINGVLQVRGTDYVATTGTSITGLTALIANDIVTVVCYAPFNVANTIAPTLVDAKGDLIVATAADTVGRLAVGTTADQQLIVDSSTSTGLKWGSPSGMVLLSTASFSAVTAVNLPTNTFTSSYDNYKIMFTISAVSGSNEIRIRGRVSGTDDSAANYNYQGSDIIGNGGSPNRFSATAQTSGYMAYNDAPATTVIEVWNPKASLPTVWQAWSNLYVNTNSAGFQITRSNFSATTSFDSMSIISSAGTITGSYSVYGYRK